jgi:gamma-glutamylcyclotransferase (GGCT)/AIG2-like uncharacterized protein YtfP
MERLFVYGTLKRGNSNHRFLEEYEGVTASADNIDLFDGPGFPYALYGKGTIHGELYEIDKDTLLRIDLFEGHPRLFKREKIIVETGTGIKLPAWCYFANKEFPDKIKIDSGVWEEK